MISVIIPTYNRQRTIERAIRSVLNQTYNDVEVIIVDDMSSDNTEEVVKLINDSRVKYIKHKENKGACAARNTGIKNCNGEFIAFLDSDDEWKINKLEKQLDYLRKYDKDIVFCSHKVYHENHQVIVPNNKIEDNKLFEKLLYNNFITTGAILAKRECFDELFDESLPRFQDWDLMIRMCKKYKVSHINKVLTYNYVQEDSLTKNYEKGLYALNKIYSKYKEDISEHKYIEAKFNSKMAALAIQCDSSATKYFRKSLKCKFEVKCLIKYIIYLISGEKFLKK